MSEFKKIKNTKYILLETFKKNNQSVKTPVWFVHNNELLYVVTRDKTGKIKRIRNNPRVNISRCTFSGKPLGKPLSGIAKFSNEDEAKTAIDLRKQKYRLEKIARFVSKSKGNLIVFSIKLNEES